MIFKIRRKEGLKLTDKVVIQTPDWPKKWQKEILAKTNAEKIKRGKKVEIKKA